MRCLGHRHHPPPRLRGEIMRTIRERYNNDPNFHSLVSLMVAHFERCFYTPSEMREAALLASIIYEEHHIRKMVVVNDGAEHCLKYLMQTIDGD